MYDCEAVACFIPFVSSNVKVSVYGFPVKSVLGCPGKNTPVLSVPENTVPVTVIVTSAARAAVEKPAVTRIPTINGERAKYFWTWLRDLSPSIEWRIFLLSPLVLRGRMLFLKEGEPVRLAPV
jgi:hypothetical protein